MFTKMSGSTDYCKSAIFGAFLNCSFIEVQYCPGGLYIPPWLKLKVSELKRFSEINIRNWTSRAELVLSYTTKLDESIMNVQLTFSSIVSEICHSVS